MEAPGWSLVCRACRWTGRIDSLVWACPVCDGLLDIAGPVVNPMVDPTPASASASAPPPAGTPAGVGAPWSMWRYAAALPPEARAGAARVTMGEGMTPLVATGTDDVWWKMDHLMPTLSFKDRGAAVLMAVAAATGVEAVVADSSGNAGIAIAAYAARAGIAASVYVPAATGRSKRAAIERVGGRVHVVDGDRAAAATAARAAVTGAGGAGPTAPVYASHVHQPLFTQGTKTFAYECWEQLGGQVPGTVVIPAGNGTLLLGTAIGFAELVAAGLAPAAPVLVAVQSERCAPIYAQWARRADPGAAAPAPGPTAAEGIAITEPPRLDQQVRAVRASGGRVILAPEDGIGPARADLGSRGIDVEPTSAATWAAWRALPAEVADALPGPVVIPLCGAGLKSP